MDYSEASSIENQHKKENVNENNNHIDAIENLILVQEIIKENSTKTEQEPSIYEAETQVYDQQNLKGEETSQFNFTYSATDKKLCFIGNDAKFIPSEIINQFGLKTVILDISFNCISDLKDLEQFPYIEELICDNNEITENSNYPLLKTLKLFSCNKNKIENINFFIEKIKIKFPNITYLTMLGNLACPNQLVDSTKDEYDYSRYRKFVLHSLRKLKFLDSYEITEYEKEILQKESQFYNVITYDEQKDKSKKTDDKTQKNDKWTPLPDQIEKKRTIKSSFGYAKYTYQGKQSEGNRFIRNDAL